MPNEQNGLPFPIPTTTQNELGQIGYSYSDQNGTNYQQNLQAQQNALNQVHNQLGQIVQYSGPIPQQGLLNQSNVIDVQSQFNQIYQTIIYERNSFAIGQYRIFIEKKPIEFHIARIYKAIEECQKPSIKEPKSVKRKSVIPKFLLKESWWKK